MNNNKKDPNELVQSWLDEILNKLDIPEPESFGIDEHAAASAGLTHPDDMELEKIVQETLAENWGEDVPQEVTVEEDADTSTRFFVPPQAENPEAECKPAEKQENPSAEIRKTRPKAKKGAFLFGIPSLLAHGIWLVLIVFVGIALGKALWAGGSDLLALGKEPKEITITVAENDKLSDIAEKLKDAGMIEYPSLFKAFANLTKKGNNILVGDITFSDTTVYDYNALINAMSYKGTARITIDVLIPEGYSCAQIFALLEEKGVCKVADLEKHAAEGELEDYWFLDGIERGHKYCLEGFLFPDTYEFYVGDEPNRVIDKFLSNFEYRFSDRLIDKMATLCNKTGLQMDVRKVVTMASIVEKEKASDLEGYSISSVFYNRLMNSAKYPFLNSDATVIYDIEYYSKGQLVTDEQINASPYNTYTKRGLPAGPIANPGLSSLDAALDPEDTPYFYFIYDKNAGCHRFSKNLVEHSEWATKLGLG